MTGNRYGRPLENAFPGYQPPPTPGEVAKPARAMETRPPSAVGKVRETAPINPRGDRLLVGGEPGVLEHLQQMRSREARITAEERALGWIEHVTGLREVLTEAQREQLVAVMVTMVHEACVERDERHTELLRGMARYIPPSTCMPDPRDKGGLVLEVGGAPLQVEG